MSNGLLIHVRANPLLGTSRLLRSLALAERWIAEGSNVTFVTSDIPALLLRKVAIIGCRARYMSTPVGSPKFAKRLCELAQEDGCSTIVTDDTSNDLLNNLGKNKLVGQKHIVLGHCELRTCDFSTATEPSFALIRRNLRLSPAHQIGRRGKNKRCLVDLSGIGPEESSDFLKSLIKRFTGTEVVFDIVTPFAVSAAEQLYQQQSPIRNYIFWHRNPDRVFQALYAFDIAVMSQVEDFYETSFSRVPGLLLAEQPFPNCNDFAELTKTPWLLSPCADGWIETACAWIEELLGNKARRRRHSGDMTRLVDDQGADRLCDTIRRGFGELERVRSA